MKILDSSSVVGVLSVTTPNLIDNILKLGHELVIPREVRAEVMRGSSASMLTRQIGENKIRVEEVTSRRDLASRKNRGLGLGLGELDVILTYEKLDGSNAYCIIDEKKARRVARSRGIPFMGLLGLLMKTRDGGIMTAYEFDESVRILKRSGFYMPAGF